MTFANFATGSSGLTKASSQNLSPAWKRYASFSGANDAAPFKGPTNRSRYPATTGAISPSQLALARVSKRA
jgi:hypothetical protein